MDDQATTEQGLPDKNENMLDLNFVPTWARKPPENPYVGRDNSERESRSAGKRGDDRRGMGRRSGPRHAGPGGRRDLRPRGERREDGYGRHGAGPGGGSQPQSGERAHRASSGRIDARDSQHKTRRRPRRDSPRLDVKVSFLPNRERLALVVRDIQASRRAVPLIEIANHFLGREDLYLVKLEWPPSAEGTPRQTFAQCLECKRVFRQRANAEAHILNDHLDKFFVVEEVEAEPPSGSFSFVARCRLSGTLLGPPNHHGYNEKIQEVWSSRFAHMSRADYLGHIETVRDEALVAQWQDSLRKKTVYRCKEVPEGEEAQPMTMAQAQDRLRGSRVNALIRESARCIVPGPLSKTFDDPALRGAVAHAWQRETRFPFTVSLALRPAFRHMRLHLFKVNARETYVSAIAPKPVDLANAPEVVKEIITFLESHPGSTRHQVLDGLRAGSDPESAVASELLLHLGNLIINGGVIEFNNGALALPRGKAVSETPPPAAKPNASAEAAPPAEQSDGDPAAVTPGEAGSVPADSAASAEDVPTTAAPENKPDPPAEDTPATDEQPQE